MPAQATSRRQRRTVDLPVRPLRLPIDGVQLLSQRTYDQILTVRRELVDNRKPEAALYKRQRLIRTCIEDLANLRRPA